MHSLRTAVRRAWRWLSPGGAGPAHARGRLVPVVIGLVVVLGTATGAVLATVNGKPGPTDPPSAAGRPYAGSAAAGNAAGNAAVNPGVPGARPSAAASGKPVVPLLSGTADGRGSSVQVPVVRASDPPGTGQSRPASVAPLRALRQADLLVVAPFPLSGRVLASVSRQPGVTGAEPIEAAKVKINGAYTATLGVRPSTFRGYAAGPTAASDKLWQGVAGGGIAVSYTMGKLDRLSLGGQLTLAGQRLERLPVVAFGTVGIGGVDAVVSDSVARSLGMPAQNAIVVSATPASVASLAARIKRLLPSGASVEPLVTQVTSPSRAGLTPASVAAGGTTVGGTTAGGTAPGGTAPGGPVSVGPVPGGPVSAAQLTAALRAAESKRGLPYQWGAAGPAAFDCSGLVQWSFAQAGIVMPRVAADQARTGAAVPVSGLQPGDLLFYHTDPTAPGYISHVAIYLGNGWMLQAPQPGMNVELVPASFGSQFAGAVRVYPQVAARVAAGLA